MSNPPDPIVDLETLNRISLTLNQAVDVRTALQSSLFQLIELMGLETGWVFVVEPQATDRWGGPGFILAAHQNLPPGMSLSKPSVWYKGCDCQTLCLAGRLIDAYNEVQCSRLAEVTGDRRGLTVHATAPLRSGNQIVGILNVAASDWGEFTPRSLTLLSNVGSQMGIALERARLFDILQAQRLQEQAVLLDLSQQLLNRRDLDELMKFIVEEVRELVSADACAILLTGPEPGTLTFRAASGWRSDPVTAGFRVPADETTGSGRVMQSQETRLLENLANEAPPQWTSEWLESEGFQAAAIVPLVAGEESIGTLVIDSRRPRRFTETEVRLLRLMANQAAIAIENARLQLEEIQRQRIEEELDVARKIQLSMLPAGTPQVPGWQFATYFEAARQVGGDFYDLFQLPGEPDRWGVVMADVSDKGVPAALYMALSRTTIRNIALRGRNPAEVLSFANRFLQEDSRADMLLTAFYAELDTSDGRLTYANAGHNPPLWWHCDEFGAAAFSGVSTSCPLLGVFLELVVPIETIVLAPGDVLVMYTDGITEAINNDYEEFGLKRLESIVRKTLTTEPFPTAEQLRDVIREAVEAFVGNMIQYDDIALLIVKRNEVVDASP
ncbi:MAG: GAF domain-containing SpoIIE family protein phosphatase [Chloroflexota bacterium]|jgi:serine phosphatase RsbU (regulator of sigma subunit)